MDLITGSTFIGDAVAIAFITNETISIIENTGLMGINILAVIIKVIEVLNKRAESEKLPVEAKDKIE